MNVSVRCGIALLTGALFAFGLVLSGMTNPANVLGFLNIAALVDAPRFGVWNASLAFVMMGALLATSVAFALMHRQKRPWLTERFELPTRTDIDSKLVLGAILFGIGWGLAGYCPGPALASVLLGGKNVLLFVLSMLAGMWLAKRWLK